MRKSDPILQLEKFLQRIASRAPSASIILVGTHKDEGVSVTPPAFLFEQYPQIRASIEVSNVDQEGITELKRTLGEIAKIHAQTVHSEHHNFYLSLCANGNKMMKLEESKRIATAKDAELNKILPTLRDLSYLFDFSAEEGRDVSTTLKEWIILDLQWFIDRMSLFSSGNCDTNGWLAWECVRQNMDFTELCYFLAALQACGIIFSLPHDPVLVPSLLPRERPQNSPSVQDLILRKFEFGKEQFLGDILATIITSNSLKDSVLKEFCWKEGAFIQDAIWKEPSPVVLQQHKHSLLLKGNNLEAIEDVTKSIRKALRRRWPELTFQTILSCPSPGCKEFCFHLDYLERKNVNDTVECQFCGSTFSVSQVFKGHLLNHTNLPNNTHLPNKTKISTLLGDQAQPIAFGASIKTTSWCVRVTDVDSHITTNEIWEFHLNPRNDIRKILRSRDTHYFEHPHKERSIAIRDVTGGEQEQVELIPIGNDSLRGEIRRGYPGSWELIETVKFIAFSFTWERADQKCLESMVKAMWLSVESFCLFPVEFSKIKNFSSKQELSKENFPIPLIPLGDNECLATSRTVELKPEQLVSDVCRELKKEMGALFRDLLASLLVLHSPSRWRTEVITELMIYAIQSKWGHWDIHEWEHFLKTSFPSKEEAQRFASALDKNLAQKLRDGITDTSNWKLGNPWQKSRDPEAQIIVDALLENTACTS